MIKKIVLSGPINVSGNPDLMINFFTEPLVDICLCLHLLRCGVCNQIYLSDQNGISVRISHDKEVKFNDRARLSASGKNREFLLALSSKELDYWVSFFSSYYVEGLAAVDHIDLEVCQSNRYPDSLSGYITLKAKSAKSPVSAHEAKRRLGLK